jgi:surface antigen
VGGIKMYRRIVSIIVILTFFTVISGCASIPEQHKGAATGAGIGAATGAVAGALLGSSGAKTEMAVLGGLAGALAGGLIGHYVYDQKNNKEETEQKYKYNPSKGQMVKIEDADVVPVMAKPGETIDIKMTYAVLGAGTGGELEIKETREIRHNGKNYGNAQVKLFRTDGTYSSSIPITLPNDAKSGKYNVLLTVKAPKAKDTKEVTFTVR